MTAMDVEPQPVPLTALQKGKMKAVDPLLLSSLPWVEKYRPETFEDVVSHANILQTSGLLLVVVLVTDLGSVTSIANEYDYRPLAGSHYWQRV